MSERREHLEHLQQLLQQRNNLVEQLEEIQKQSTRTKDLILKTQGAIEYLEAIGITEIKQEVDPTPEPEPEPEKQAPPVKSSFLPLKG